MNKLLVSVSLLTLFLGLFGCASSGIAVDSKYELEGLDQVERFPNYNLTSWQVVDDQSLVVQTSPSTYYLIVLKRSMVDLRFARAISFTSTGNMVYTNIDRVKALRRHSSMPPEEAAIHRIYKLKGKEDVARAKAQIESSDNDEESDKPEDESAPVQKNEVLLTT